MKKNNKMEDKKMALSMAIVPLLRGEAAKSLLETVEHSRIKPYSLQEKVETEQKIREIIEKRSKRI